METEEQKALLVAMGCREFQGHLLSLPLEPAQLLRLAGLLPGKDSTPAAVSA